MEAEGLRGAARHASESAMTGVEAGLTGEEGRDRDSGVGKRHEHVGECAQRMKQMEDGLVSVPWVEEMVWGN